MRKVICILLIPLAGLIVIFGCGTSMPIKEAMTKPWSPSAPPEAGKPSAGVAPAKGGQGALPASGMAPAPAPILVDRSESAAQDALVQGNWDKAYAEYVDLLKKNIKSPLAEYYLYSILLAQDYGASANDKSAQPAAVKGNHSDNDFPELINYICGAPDANANLRALALWMQVNTYIKQGEIEKAKDSCSRLGFIQNYLFIGPFENEEKTGFNTVYDVEKELDLDKTYTGKQGQNKWFSVSAAPVWGWVDMSALFRLKDDVLSYALTFVNAPAEQDAVIRLGSDGAVKLWLNDQLVMVSDTFRGLSLDQNLAGVHLSKGWNKILIKVCQKARPWKFMVRLTDTNGQTLTNLKCMADPKEIKQIIGTLPKATAQSVITPTNIFSYLSAQVAENPNDAVSLRRLAFLYDARKMLDENDRQDRDELKKALELDDKDVLTHIAFTHAEPDRNKRLDSYKKALALAPKSPLVYYELSRAYTTDPSFFKGLEFDWWNYFEEMFDKIISGEGDYSDFESVDYDKEQRQAQKHTLSPKRMPFPLEVKEIEYLNKALELKPDFIKAKMALGKVYERKTDGGSSRYRSSSRYSGSGNIWDKEALRLFEECLQVVPDSAELQEPIFESQEHTPDEVAAFNKELLAQDFTNNKARIAQIGWARKKGDFAGAIKLCRDMLAINPYAFKAYELIAKIYQSQDDWANGILATKNALAISPEDTALLQQLANLELYQSDTKAAIGTLETALAIKPQLKEVERHLKYLKTQEQSRSVAQSGTTKDFWSGYEENIADYVAKAQTAVQTAEKEPARFILNNQIIRVKPNGTSSAYFQQVIKIFDENGRNEYSSVYAWPRGMDYYPATKSEVKEAKIYRKQPAPEAGEPTPSTEWTEIEGHYYENSPEASFERLAIGDILTFECQIDEVGEGRYKDYFGLMCPLQTHNEPVETAKLTLMTPKDKKVNYHAIHCKNPEPSATEKDNLLVRNWTETNIPQIKQEEFMPAEFEIWPYVHFSTFNTWDEVADWFWGIAKDQMETSPELKAAVAQAIEGITDKRQKIKAIHQLLVSDIRYAEISLDSHHFKPFKASDTFARKYGDCKDTAILMLTMLKEAGIAADPVLIRAEPNWMGVVNTDLPSMKIFNHAIVHLTNDDGSDYFLDGTARYYGAEELPQADQGAVAFVVSTTGTSRCFVTAFKPAEDNVMDANYTIEMTPNRDAVMRTQSVYKGLMAPEYREMFQDGTKQKLLYEQFCNRYFKGSVVQTLEFSDLKNYNQPVEMKSEVKLSEFARAEAGKIIFKPVPIPPDIFGMSLADMTSVQTRYYDMVLYNPFVIKATITYKIPDGYTFKYIPENVTLDNDYSGFNCLLNKIDDKTMAIHIEFVLKKSRIPKDKYDLFREFCSKVQQAIEREVVLEAK